MKIIGLVTAVLIARAQHEGTPILQIPAPISSPAPAPPPAPPAPPPSSAPAPATAPIPVEFNIQIKSVYAGRGLDATLWYPQPGSDLPIYRDRVGIVYEWRPDDGLEERINRRTGKPWGPIWKDSIAEQMVPENLERHLATVDKWITAHIPADFEGPVSIDVERWPLRSDTFHLVKEPREALERLQPGRTQAQLWAEFIKVTTDRAKKARPRVSGWGWWSLGTMHPGFTTWHNKLWNQWVAEGYRADRDALTESGIPFPSFYFPTTYPQDGARAVFWKQLQQSWQLLYGPERLARDGYAYLNVRHSGLADKAFADKPITREQLHECVQAAWDVGIRRFVIWDAIDSPKVRDINQKFISEILTPEARYWADRSREERSPRR